MEKQAFNSEKYLQIQKEKILERCKLFGKKLYIEFGGKLFDDLHASRVLPGYNPNNKIKLLETMKDDIEILFCVSAKDIENNKIRADFGITYDREVLRLIDELRELGIMVNSVVITMFNQEPNAVKFANLLKANNINVYYHKCIKGYPNDVETIVSDSGYGANDYVETIRPIVVVTAPGPGSGKLATCLSQLYHEKKRGVEAGYAKFETFPVWNLPLKHPVNIAYEAATTDLRDVNMIDNYHLEKYGKVAINYNRDLETFPIVRQILFNIYGKDIYFSPTDMGVNMVGFCIDDEKKVKDACEQEVVRRFLKAKVDFKRGQEILSAFEKNEMLMKEMNLTPNIRKCVEPALEKAMKTKTPCIAIELNDGRIVAGKTTDVLSASASVILNALKTLANIGDEFKLISPEILKPITTLKMDYLNNKNYKLSLKDILIALSVCATTNDMAKKALETLPLLAGAKAHSSVILTPNNEEVFRKLKIDITSEDVFDGMMLFRVWVFGEI